MTQVDEPCPFRRRIRKEDRRSGSEFPRESRHHDSAVQQRSGADRWLAFARPRLLTAALGRQRGRSADDESSRASEFGEEPNHSSGSGTAPR